MAGFHFAQLVEFFDVATDLILGSLERVSVQMTGKIMVKSISVLFLALALQGCASKSSEVSAAYVSPLTYQNYSCQQLAEEATRVSSRAQQLAGAQDSKRTSDGVAITVAVIVFWPALFAVKGDDNTTAELARLKGELETIEKVSIQKKCAITFQREPAKTS